MLASNESLLSDAARQELTAVSLSKGSQQSESKSPVSPVLDWRSKWSFANAQFTWVFHIVCLQVFSPDSPGIIVKVTH